jgi:hypothetical protein
VQLRLNEPIRQCELELGKPNHQVPIFQKRAAESKMATLL